jgi:hypothetical protein
MPHPRIFFVYIMTNGPLPAVLYVGITSDLAGECGNTETNEYPGSPAATT